MTKIRNGHGLKTSDRFENDLNAEDNALFEKFGDYMKGSMDIEDVQNDPGFADMRISAEQMAGSTGKSMEITNFISDALKSSENKEVNSGEEIEKSSSLNIFVRYILPAAAALAGVFIIIRSLMPVNNPDSIFISNYTPFDAISDVTRSIESNQPDVFSHAVALYKTGDYAKALEEFSAISGKDPAMESPRFFTGLSQVALSNYNAAIPLLLEVSLKRGEYSKDARWYLGLAYLKISDIQKARECFVSLSRADGYYRERSEKILRRLK